MALLQKWREKHGPYATYRNLAKSFYDAGRPDLVETVCEVMTCDYPLVNTSPISLSRAIPNATAVTSSTIGSNDYLVLLLFSVILSFTERADTEGTEVGRIHYGRKTSEFAPNNLPHLPGPFIGRDEDMENITHLLKFSKYYHTQMVHIVGLPAVGKSTLAVHVGYEMASRGVAVRYINVDETHIFKSHEHTVTENHDQRSSTTSALTNRVSDIQLSWYSHTDKRYVSSSPEGLIQWAKGLSNDTLLILDNCDLLLQNSATQKAFVEMFVVLNKASHFLRIVTTSRLKVSLLDGFKLYREPCE